MHGPIERILRYLLALVLAVFGVDKFLHFMPRPDPPPEGGQFLGALMDAGYVFPAIGGTFILVALCLVANRVVLGLVLLAPITINILLYHVRYDVPGIVAGAVIAGLQVVLLLMHARELAPIFRPGGDPGS